MFAKCAEKKQAKFDAMAHFINNCLVDNPVSWTVPFPFLEIKSDLLRV